MAREGKRGRNVGHHRFKAILEVIMSEPGNTDMSDPDPAPDDLANDLTDQIKTKSKPKKGGKEYTIEKVTRVTKP
jgi:hypothetical protein